MRETAVAHESYSFACMRCGHGWEQSYDIEHHTDGDGNEFVLYVTDGRVVPSPLRRPACRNCDGRVLRIMRAGQVASAQLHRHAQRPAGPVVAPVPGAPSGEETAAGHRDGHHHWHLSDLLHPFQHRAG
jgi:DNA-directed RNA polymerase subunit RPC12/RpoP